MSATPSKNGDAGSTVALTLLTVAGVLCLRRLFADWSYLPPVLLAVVGAHLVAWQCRRRGLRAPWPLVAPLAVGVAVISWIELPETTFFGVPTSATWHAAGDQLSASLNDFKSVVAPAPVLTGFIIAVIIAGVVGATLADWAAYRMDAAFEATIPSFAFFVFAAALGTARYRPLTVAVELSALFLFLLAHQTGVRSRASAWFASRSPGGWLQVARPGLVMAAVAVVAAMLFGPSVPGASSAALLSWRNQDHNGPASRSTVSPFVTIRNRLVNQSGTIVFSVQSPQKAYWRLTSLDNFDGDIWSSNDSYRPVDSGRLPRDNGEALSAASVRQAYTINTLDSIWLPAAFQPTRIGNLDNVSYNTDSGSLISASDTTNGETYTVTSALPQLTGSELGSAPAVDPNASSLKKYVQLPAIPKTVRDLAARVVAGHPTEYDKALAIQNYLRAAPFSYNLNVPAGHSGNALERFLFVTHQGYCEQFAGSYAVMARAVGLPARVAVGFTPGEYDPSTGTYTVRDEHAHAWPEIYFPSTGWVAFEPTPGRGAPNATSYTGVPEAQAGQPANSTTQPTTAPSTTPTTVSPGGSSNTTIPKDEVLKDGTQRQTHHTSVFERLLWILLGLLGVAAIWAVGVPSLRAWLRHRRRVAGEAVGPDGRVLVAWEEANDTLANVGAGRLASETLDEHARRAAVVAKLDADSKAALAALAGDAVAASYSGLPASSDDATRAVAAAHAVEQAVHSSASRPDRIKWALDPRPLVRNRFVARSERQRARTDQKTPV